jgi:hypothetical protein
MYNSAKQYGRKNGYNTAVDVLEFREQVIAEIDLMASQLAFISDAMEFCVDELVGKPTDAVYLVDMVLLP